MAIKKTEQNKNNKNEKKSSHFFCVCIILTSLILLFCLNLTSLQVAKNFLKSLKYTIQTLKPTEELFDDNGGVKLVSVLFPVTTAQVSTQLLNFRFKIDNFETSQSTDGVITLNNPSGLVYANESGVIEITHISEECDELKIVHSFNTQTSYSCKFIFGVKDGQYVEKGEPLALVLSPKLEFFITHNDEIISDLELVQGELVWKE